MSADPADRIEELTGLLSRLPGLGPRSARRVVLYLIRRRGTLMAQIARSMEQVARDTRECRQCGNVSMDELCAICANPARANGQICVVEDLADLWAVERGRAFRGRYHVLGGTLSALDAVGPEDLGIPRLLDRIGPESVSEVILALNATVEGQTTAHYIADALHDSGVTVTGLAQGVPIGGELDYLDDGTISAALNARKRV
ncbi:recombination mediator RecR [Paracoccus pacificus]|uniref:Recombination protein RecR n=1 Tax=Paracoccus pacificus TaxID=1463598 RepID=A0ABW4RB14_9RHOB